MSKSQILEFDYLASGQTEKHLSVNDALARLESGMSLSLNYHAETLPLSPADTLCYHVSPNDPNFSAEAGKIAFAQNGGYEFVAPKAGMRAYFRDLGIAGHFDGSDWRFAGELRIDRLMLMIGGADVIIPAGVSLVGVTGRVRTALEGDSATSWSLGTSDDHARYGQGLWLGQNGYLRGLTGAPMSYWADTPLIASADAGSLTAGEVELYLHYFDLPIPPES